ncbi:MAG TPA: disulfide bond formation protein DsbA [Methylophilaceae bacterium]|nr:disulfide bond formation protein DsbA [Methylophilaceae bacterium]HAJ71672.1 disulfide bond formation protein DsbA [Methylophilaceae bacterium]
MKKFLTALMLILSTHVFATETATQESNAFEAVAQVIPTDKPAKIEVMEIFWYGCIHCYHMDPLLNAWVKKLPSDVYFKRVPGLPNPSWAPMAKAYFAMETLGLLEKLHTPLFDAVHKQKTINPTDEKAIIEWVTKQSGLDKLKVEQAFSSFTTSTNLNRAAQVFRASGATGVPSLIIDGKYLTSSTMAGSNEEAIKTADFIIANVRKDKTATTKK